MKFLQLQTNNYKLQTNQKGFTLIELLVVIAIIGMLSSVILASMNTARTNARDVKRMADVKAIQTALEMYYSSNNTYPVAAAPIPITEASVLGALTPNYILRLPTDPIFTGSDGFLYAASSPVNGYAIAIQKENGYWCQFRESTGYTTWTFPLCNQ